MGYITITLNHMRAVRAWADAQGADASLDLRNWELELRCRHRYFRFSPRFIARRAGRTFHTHELAEHVTGFIGWLPYGVLRYELSDDKLVFKACAAAAGLKVPARWPARAPEGDYILKRSMGSFGYEICGPYRAGAAPARMPADREGGAQQGEVFAEQYIPGDSLKVWFWGRDAFFAHRQPRPQVVGDGRWPLRALVADRTLVAAEAVERSPEFAALQEVLAYQGFSLDDVLPEGRCAWLDFRYGRTYEPEQAEAGSDSQFESLPAATRAEVDRMGALLATQLQERFPAPVLYAVDGVIDADGAVWWLEVNSNPALPPDGYERIFTTLFGSTRS